MITYRISFFSQISFKGKRWQFIATNISLYRFVRHRRSYWSQTQMESLWCLHCWKSFQFSVLNRIGNIKTIPLWTEKQSNRIAQNEFNIFTITHHFLYNCRTNRCRASRQHCYKQAITSWFGRIGEIRINESRWENLKREHRNK